MNQIQELRDFIELSDDTDVLELPKQAVQELLAEIRELIAYYNVPR